MCRVTTDRIELKPVSAETATALGADRVLASHMLEAELPADWPHPDFLDVIRAWAAASHGRDHFGVWVIVDRASATVVGDVGFHGPPDKTGTVEIGYSVVPDQRRRGYATEAASTIVRWALSRPDVRTVVASCDPDNQPSIRVLESVGFHRTGEADGEIQWRYGGDGEVSSPGVRPTA